MLLSRGLKKNPTGYLVVTTVIAIGIWLERYVAWDPAVEQRQAQAVPSTQQECACVKPKINQRTPSRSSFHRHFRPAELTKSVGAAIQLNQPGRTRRSGS